MASGEKYSLDVSIDLFDSAGERLARLDCYQEKTARSSSEEFECREGVQDRPSQALIYGSVSFEDAVGSSSGNARRQRLFLPTKRLEFEQSASLDNIQVTLTLVSSLDRAMGASYPFDVVGFELQDSDFRVVLEAIRRFIEHAALHDVSFPPEVWGRLLQFFVENNRRVELASAENRELLLDYLGSYILLTKDPDAQAFYLSVLTAYSRSIGSKEVDDTSSGNVLDHSIAEFGRLVRAGVVQNYNLVSIFLGLLEEQTRFEECVKLADYSLRESNPQDQVQLAASLSIANIGNRCLYRGLDANVPQELAAVAEAASEDRHMHSYMEAYVEFVRRQSALDVLDVVGSSDKRVREVAKHFFAYQDAM